MSSAFKIFGFVIVISYLTLNYYIGLRSLQALRAFNLSLRPMIFWPIFLFIAFAYILDRLFAFNIPLLKIAGSYWLAAFFYLFILFVLIDIIGLIHTSFHLFPASWGWLWQSKKIYALALILTTGILVIGSWLAQSPSISRYSVNIAGNSPQQSDLKIVLISDLHVEPHAPTGYMEKAAELISSLNPDLILVAGDIVEGAVDPLTQEKLGSVISRLKAKHGIFAVLGNHEYYGGQADQITAYLEREGIEVLRDEVKEIIDGNVLIAGREDYRSGHVNTSTRKSLESILAGVDSSKPLLLLDHQPQAVTEAQKAGVNLMLSGHTHGGQMFPVQFATKALFVIDRGLWRQDDFHLVVSTGLGVWGPPIRTSAKSEIVEINFVYSE